MGASGFTTRILHADRCRSRLGAIHAPIHTSIPFCYGQSRDLARVFQGSQSGFTYARSGHPTAAPLEAQITAMENGVASVVFATGMAAIASTLLALLRHGDHIVASEYLFANTSSLLNTLSSVGLTVSFVDATDVSHVAAAVTARTRIVLVETIANPRTQVADLDGIGELCRRRDILYVVDNTMTSPYLFLPKRVGASLVLNSLTKCIGGHGDALGGSLTDTGLYDWSIYPNIYDCYKVPQGSWGMLQIRKKGLRDMGAALAPDAAHRLAVGAETLALRMERTCENALALATYLEGHEGVRRIYYPGLAGHPEHRRACSLFKGAGGLLALELAPDIDCFDFVDSLETVACSAHLGDTRTLAIPVAHTIFHEIGAEGRARMGIADSLIRVSVGIEEVDDLVGDFEQAFRCGLDRGGRA